MTDDPLLHEHDEPVEHHVRYSVLVGQITENANIMVA